MKSIINKDKPLPFPKLMIETTEGSIYLMGSETKGICVYHNASVGLSGLSIRLDPILMQDWKGTITLSN